VFLTYKEVKVNKIKIKENYRIIGRVRLGRKERLDARARVAPLGELFH